jgi:hypothetical protein
MNFALVWQSEEGNLPCEWVPLLYKGAWYTNAEKMAVRSLQVRRLVVSEEHKDTLISIGNKALVLKAKRCTRCP